MYMNVDYSKEEARGVGSREVLNRYGGEMNDGFAQTGDG